MSIQPKILPKSIPLDNGATVEVVFRRPGYEGIKRIAKHYASAVADPNPFAGGAPSNVVESEVGRGALMEAVLMEYLAEAPSHWWIGNKQPAAGERGRVNTDQDVAEFLAVGKEALTFHESFRDVDAGLRATRRA